MSAFGEILIEGAVELARAIFGVAEDAASESPEVKKHFDKAKAKAQKIVSEKVGKRKSTPKDDADGESINKDEYLAHRNAKLMPQIRHVSKSMEADRRFDLYEKKGFLAECLRQRAERLSDSQNE